ncbi:MAG: hypothetical protein GF409_08910 [Candidatus Omnitrophica bacterium]|nr:hypothetical protein [Candidatus Omnitrophota bacterium]
MVKLPPKKVFDVEKYRMEHAPTVWSRVGRIVERIGGPRRIAVYSLMFILLVAGVVYYAFFRPVPLKVTASVHPGRILIGDTAEFTLRIIRDKDTEIELPDLEKELEDFQIRGKETVKSAFSRRRVRKTVYRITKYEPGEYKIPPLPVLYRGKGRIWKTANTREVTLRVRRLVRLDDIEPGRRINIGGRIKGGMKGTGMPSSPGASGMGEGPSVAAPIRFYIHDLEGPRKIYTWKDIALRAGLYTAGGILLLFIGLIVINTIRYKPGPGPVPLHVMALDALGKLRSEKLLEKQEYKEFCLGLSRTLMGYVRIRFKMRPVEMTSQEFINDLEQVEALGKKDKDFVKDAISLCDRIKYSPGEADKKYLEDLLGKVKAFVEKTREREEEEEEK